ncbi:ATP-binding protein [Streptomyces sp. VB1]|uniref:ATP-binding protein n=1 Tax=Streptomyces sp. VB1 TaxID=2986803 RepID=UPI0022421CDC|nr:ATP-binding protein [Streptomyces sp. VB1]UZI34038.1 ATP-binding protein [Streptomyces sp. VB1]
MNETFLNLPPGTLVVAVGPGGSGKSSFADAGMFDVVVCLDTLRGEIGGGPGDQSVTPAAVARQDALLEQYMRAGTTVFVDSTNVEAHVRAGLVERARRYGRPLAALRFLPDLATCRARNERRTPDRRVPDDTLRWQYDQAQASTADVLHAEGFNWVYEMNPLPEVRFAVITDPDRQHAFFVATIAGDLDRLVGAYASERDLTVTPFEFTDPDIVFETQRWVSGTQQETGRSPMLLVGSVENGQWVNWNLEAIPRPPVPTY